MSDDDPDKTHQHLTNFARKHNAPPPPPPSTNPSTNPSAKQGRRFGGNSMGCLWRSQAWSPDGSLLAFGGEHSRGGAGVLHIWDATSGHLEHHRTRHLTHGLTGPVISMSWSPDSRHLATAEVTSPADGPVVHIRSHDEDPRPIPVPPGVAVTQVAWSPDGTLLALSHGGDARTALIDPVSGATRRVIEHLSGPVAWQPEGRLLAGVFENSVLLVDPDNGGRVQRLAEQTHPPRAIAWSRHGGQLAVADGEEIVVYNAKDGAWRWRLHWVTQEGDRGPEGTITHLEWLDGGGYLLEFRPRGGAWHDERGTTVAETRLWDIETGRSLWNQRNSELVNQVRLPSKGVAVSPDGRRYAIVDDNHAPYLWEFTGDMPHFVP